MIRPTSRFLALLLWLGLIPLGAAPNAALQELLKRNPAADTNKDGVLTSREIIKPRFARFC